MEKIEHTTVYTNGINMHIASIGTGPVILFLHGFPDLWYTWRHQLLSLSSLGYRCIAPDLRGFGDTDAPPSPTEYTVLHIVGDLVGLLDSLGIEQVFLVGHDWGATIAWHLCLFRPDRIKALVNTSVAFYPRNPHKKPVERYRELLGDDFYICRFQEHGEIEEDFAQAGVARVIKRFFASRSIKPPCVPKETGFRSLPVPQNLPSWLSEEDINYYVSKYDQKGFSGGLNYYRCLDSDVPQELELTAPWTGYKLRFQLSLLWVTGTLPITSRVEEYIHHGGMKKYVPFLQEVVVLEGVAHFLSQEKPEEVSAHIHDFIKKF